MRCSVNTLPISCASASNPGSGCYAGEPWTPGRFVSLCGSPRSSVTTNRNGPPPRRDSEAISIPIPRESRRRVDKPELWPGVRGPVHPHALSQPADQGPLDMQAQRVLAIPGPRA
jgi:hypothetical protein